MSSKPKKKLSDFCRECEAVQILKTMLRGGDMLSGFARGRRFLEQKLGPDPNRDQPEGHEDHLGMRRFDLVTYEFWDTPCWMEDTGDAEFWRNSAGGRCPKGKSMRVIETVWAKSWPADPNEEADTEC